MIIKSSLYFLMALLFTQPCLSKEFPVQARLFAGSLSAKISELNTEFSTLGLKELDDNLLQLGVEMTYPVAKFLDVGMRYSRRGGRVEENPNSTATEYFGDLTQESILLLARVPFFSTPILRLDVFAGIGGSNTEVELVTATVTGKLSKKEAKDYWATPYTSAGASASIGYDKFFFFIEAGVESNKVKSLKRTGNVSTNVNEIDMSGSYILAGLRFEGVSATKR